MFLIRWRCKCRHCPTVWDTQLPDDTDPDFNGDRCPDCGELDYDQVEVSRT